MGMSAQPREEDTMQFVLVIYDGSERSVSEEEEKKKKKAA
jgi:hypothetical protein